MMYKLLLVVLLANGNEDAKVMNTGLTRDECITTMIAYNKAFKTDSFVCEGIEIGNENYTSVLLNNNTTLLNSNNK